MIFADGSTRDQQYSKISTVVDQILPKENQFIYIQILNVISLEEFYAFIPAFFITSPHSLTAEINKRSKAYRKIKNIFGESSKLKNKKQLLFGIHVGVSGELDLVFILHSNKKFYRAKVIEIREDKVMVFCVDFGFYTYVSPDDVYEWNDQYNTPSFMAYRCSLENAHEIDFKTSFSSNQLKRMVLGRTMRAQVV